MQSPIWSGGETGMLKLPVGPLGPLPMIVSGAVQGGTLGVLPGPPILQISIKLQFGVPLPGTVAEPGRTGVSMIGGPGVRVGVAVRVEVTVGVAVGVPGGTVLVGVADGVRVAVLVTVPVLVAVLVAVRVAVAVLVLVAVRVAVPV